MAEESPCHPVILRNPAGARASSRGGRVSRVRRRIDGDAIVMGAGHNGLTCAFYLARAGPRVLVLEVHDRIGGMTRSEQMALPGFVHDVRSP